MKHCSPSRPDLVTEEDLVVDLAARVRARGDVKRLATQLGISQPALSNVLTGGRSIGDRIARALGYRKVVRYERVS